MAPRVRINGLVKVAEVIRRELSLPSTSGRRERLKQQVDTNLQIVQKILRENKATAAHLPASTQRAYLFLKGLEWSKIAVSQVPESPTFTSPTLSWPGLSAFLERTLNRLAVDLNTNELEAIQETIDRMSRKIELTLQRKSVSADGLSPATRAQRAWLGFFSIRENLALYVDSRRTANLIFNEAAKGSRSFPPPWVIHFRPLGGIYKLRASRAHPVLWLPPGMVAFDKEGFNALALLIFRREKNARQRVLASMTGEGYQTVSAEMESLGGIVQQTKGMAHDLTTSFERVNAEYLAARCQGPG